LHPPAPRTSIAGHLAWKGTPVGRPATESAPALVERSLAAITALWAAAFAALHLAWAAGSRLLLADPAGADVAFGQPWFRRYNLAVTLACLAIVGVTAAIWRAPSRRTRRRRGWVVLAGGVLLLRGGLGAVQLSWQALTGTRDAPIAAWWVDGYMLAGGVLLVALWVRLRRDPSRLDGTSGP
jgi:hypothetical protein